MTSLWSQIRGTLSNLFSIGGPAGPNLKNNAGALEARNSADTGYAVMRGAAPVGDFDLVNKQYADTLLLPPAVGAQFNGGNALPSNSSTEQYYVVTTSGVNASIGQLLWDDGSNAGTVQVISAATGRTIITKAAFSGGTVTLSASAEYLWNGASWVNLNPTVTGGERVVRFVIGNAASQSSASTLPANAIVLRAFINITTPYSAGGTIQVGQTGTTNLLMDTTDSVATIAGQFEKRQDTAWGASPLAVLVTVGGSPAAGAGVVVIEYSVPDA